jgi:sulfotransferase
MYDQFVCLSGLPRSGSTLLSAILSQNPNIHAEGNSAVCQLMWDIQQSYHTNCKEQISANEREHTIIDLIKSVPQIYYKNIDEKIIIDKCRSWTLTDNIDMLKTYIDPNYKIIVLERSIVDVVKSFHKLYLKNNVNFDLNKFFNENSEPIVRSVNGLIHARQNNQNNNFMFIKYDVLVENTPETIRKIYDFCGWEYFEHDFGNIVSKYKENDSAYNLIGFHDVNPVIKKTQNDVELPTEIFEKCCFIDNIIGDYSKVL